MKKLTQHQERFAGAMADGDDPYEAWATAGFAARHRSDALEMSQRPEIVARVAELSEPGKRAPSVKMLTRRLTHIAEIAEAQGTAAGLAVARGALMDTARINRVLRKEPEAPAQTPFPLDAEPEPPMTEAEWLAAFAHLKDR